MDNQKLINFLNQLLSNYFVLYVKLHRYHWFVQGHHFFQLHELFEEMYEQIAKDLDEVAERILAIDGKPFAVMTQYLEHTTLVEASADDQEEEIISQLMNDYKQLIREMKETGLSLADDYKDEPTSDLLITLQGRYEKYVWMLSAYQAYK
ncbi:Dps family protein [Ornithinibacillus halophilus]|uniref:Starvation-inducible DNA-binding protein n=1 Tax=Ornithinibacillus halophilus TaxID=930117 RepID=A0A1M5CFA5_9BACI|nr:DNA starvation/stationary phase protection protein [Ornithinibacillus halophilus]SHF53454.1 starvation-inducible DNA-binding protein [Ornithinibacillus halophilus]